VTHETQIPFRGTQRTVEFEHEGDEVIIWWFPDDTENADKQGGATTEEQNDIHERLWAYLLDWWDSVREDWI
jgi:hypothetical protein